MSPPQAWLDELFEYLRIPSISADPDYADDVRAAGDWVRGFVQRAGGTADFVETEAHPLVVGEIPASRGAKAAPTILLYGHFDVQPAAPEEAWESPPFEPALRDGWIYARGAADDKGNNYLLLKAAELLADDGELPVNVRVAFDGEEETGGHSIVDFLESDDREADACVIFDGHMPRVDLPAFYVGTRGLVYLRVTLRSARRDLHSGLFGGAAMNAVHALMATLQAAIDLPDPLREGVTPPTTAELDAWGEVDRGDVVLDEQGAVPSDPDAANEFYERTLASPAFDVNGVFGGEPELQKTVIPSSAHANVSLRLAPGQEAVPIAAELERLLRAAAPAGAELEIDRWATSPAALVPPDSEAIRLAQDAFERTFGVRPLLLRSGGTLPIVPALATRGIPTIVTGFDVPEGNIHSPNERLLLRYVDVGVATAKEMLAGFAQLGK